ncbi:MarR family winged helix-turn-helix transcriptional regulator [Rhizobium sp. TRM95111]|uniref:MarR family winged helix-turn-helix transcriptional regulator n=1 Tax=Rhizobium alarense TaxID=2846851 RepID=UPI001F264AD1|nr:MarR family winged helix-turn-helix transcriptional regulator [Rhizobium alarense]MCF3639470.1 MarR family winged helix-turn-helix transcriptional regulator [Rhizobium alarense]
MKEDNGVWMHCTNSAIRRAARQLGQLYDDVIEPSGLRGTQFSLLSQIALASDDGAPLKLLAEALVMDLSALGHTLKPLARDGLVELVADTHDKRVKRARLTAEGRSRLSQARLLWQDAQERFDAAFGKARSAEMRALLGAVSTPDFARAFRAAKPAAGG